MRLSARNALVIVCSGLVCACGMAPEEREGAFAAPIIGGAVDTGDPAVMLLASWPADQSTLDLCTATLIADDVLLTAAHCVDPATHPGAQFGVFTGPNANIYPTAAALIPELAPVSEVHVHPQYDAAPPFYADIAVVILATPMATPPMPVSFAPIVQAEIGGPARIVGYGQTVYEEYNAQKHSAVTSLGAIDAGDTITVGDAQHRSCLGDSGGPALMTLDGVEQVVGVNSYTDFIGCLDPAHYRRTDLFADFIQQFAPSSPPSEGGAGSGGGDSGGGAAGTGGEAATGGAGSASDTDDDDGCSLAAPGRGRSYGLALALGLAVAIRRKRRHRR